MTYTETPRTEIADLTNICSIVGIEPPTFGYSCTALQRLSKLKYVKLGIKYKKNDIKIKKGWLVIILSAPTKLKVKAKPTS